MLCKYLVYQISKELIYVQTIHRMSSINIIDTNISYLRVMIHRILIFKICDTNISYLHNNMLPIIIYKLIIKLIILLKYLELLILFCFIVHQHECGRDRRSVRSILKMMVIFLFLINNHNNITLLNLLIMIYAHFF